MPLNYDSISKNLTIYDDLKAFEELESDLNEIADEIAKRRLSLTMTKAVKALSEDPSIDGFFFIIQIEFEKEYFICQAFDRDSFTQSNDYEGDDISSYEEAEDLAVILNSIPKQSFEFVGDSANGSGTIVKFVNDSKGRQSFAEAVLGKSYEPWSKAFAAAELHDKLQREIPENSNPQSKRLKV